MKRMLVLNPVEPSPLSFRWPLGMPLTLDVVLQRQQGDAVNPDTLMPQLALMPRSLGGVFSYDMATYDPANGVARAEVPGSFFQDLAGYTLELYARTPNVNPADPPVPCGLIAKGLVALEGSAYRQMGPLGAISTPVVTGPPGPQGEQGVQGATGETGQRGSIWRSGGGPPTILAQDLPGDMYLDEATGDVWRFETATGWTRQAP